jgi:segregation and condensation protein B
MSEFEHQPEDGVEEGDPPEEGGGDTLGPGEADFSAAEGDEEFEDDELGGRPGLAGTITLADHDLRGALEALILVSDKPVPAMRLARMTRQDLGLVRRALGELAEAYRGRGIVLDEIAGGFQFRTSPRYAPFVRNLVQQKPTKLSRAQLEVLAIIAYRQPVTRPEVEDVRGVDSGSALKVLLERNVIKIIGKKDDVGRPMLYGTSNEFLELFGLKNLRDLPTLKEFAELTPESRDIYERRIGEPLPGHGQGMNLETHYEAPPEAAGGVYDEGASSEAGQGEPETEADDITDPEESAAAAPHPEEAAGSADEIETDDESDAALEAESEEAELDDERSAPSEQD